MTKQRGFTLIELIIVIIILGILAVTAAPRFFNFADDAKEAAAEGLRGAILSAANVVYARAALDNQLGATGSVALPGSGTVATVWGYPSNTGIENAVDVDGWGFSAGVFSLDSDGDCTVTYAEPTGEGAPPTVTVSC